MRRGDALSAGNPSICGGIFFFQQIRLQYSHLADDIISNDLEAETIDDYQMWLNNLRSHPELLYPLTKEVVPKVV